MNTPNPPRSRFHAANQLAQKIRPTRRFSTLDRKTFSRITQFRTGHAHIGEYYHRFGIASESKSCNCGKPTQTRAHILSKCPRISRYRLNLGRGNQTKFNTLMGKVKGVERLATFIKKSKMGDKHKRDTTGQPTRPTPVPQASRATTAQQQ
jgi:hypothetical protein